jgi:hypothetical protein
MATLIHRNRFGDSMGMGAAASMLSGGASYTAGSEEEIFANIVFPCLRGEEPKFTFSAGMGEFKMATVRDGKTVIESPFNSDDIEDISSMGTEDTDSSK